MKTIAFIEDDETLRQTLSRYFEKKRFFKVIFSVATVFDAILCNDLEPHIILLDVNLDGVSSISSIAPLAECFPKSKIIMLSNVKDSSITKKAVENGAVGYMLKTSSLSYISESLSKISDGGNAFSPETIGHLLQPEVNNETQLYDLLTKREIELIEMLSKGMANKTAAGQMNVTYFTVNQHLKNIYKKLYINSKTELLSWYFKKKQ